VKGRTPKQKRPTLAMKDNKAIHPLAAPNEKSGKIRFIHYEDGKEHYFASAINRLNGCRMSYFDNHAPSVDDSLKWVRSVFRDIRKKATKVIEVIGDF
jgi:hypothetical protein